jgi:NAD(P)-dependent dehydrogenase (short-subunit alcohol dehydrogenase family)
MQIEPLRAVAGKIAIITGAGRGLGRGTAEALADAGVHVVVSDILPQVNETIAQIKAKHPDNQGYAPMRTRSGSWWKAR